MNKIQNTNDFTAEEIIQCRDGTQRVSDAVPREHSSSDKSDNDNVQSQILKLPVDENDAIFAQQVAESNLTPAMSVKKKKPQETASQN